MKTLPLFFLLYMLLMGSSCNYIRKINEDPIPTFTEIKGIKYTEVRRSFQNGLSFNEQGFQLEPEWNIYFNADDSVKIFSPVKQQYMTYRIFHSHKALFQFAREWFRVQHVSKDSILLQVMELEARVLKEDKSTIYMKLYSDDYIKKVLKADAATLKQATREDSLFIKYRAIQANSNLDSAFAARTPVVLSSRSKITRVEKLKASLDPYLGHVNRSEEYLYPEYRINIDKAYKDFQYSFSVLVDHNGKMHFKEFLVAVEPEFLESKTKVAKGIIDVYLRNTLSIKPGSTLGFPHTSLINLHIIGRK
ncbi:hypothetical protein [Daejeonella sp.]|jgi:hypothetical protein|uniref:hypothetical protein n=1 Tax=Daejeonella sp. TaxID=2805397 RepID=UPI0037850476